MSNWTVLLENGAEITVEAKNATEARYHAFDRAMDAQVFSIRPEGCTGLSATAHAGGWCPVHGHG